MGAYVFLNTGLGCLKINHVLLTKLEKNVGSVERQELSGCVCERDCLK